MTSVRPIRSFSVKYNHIGSVFSVILRYLLKKLTTLYNWINRRAQIVNVTMLRKVKKSSFNGLFIILVPKFI